MEVSSQQGGDIADSNIENISITCPAVVENIEFLLEIQYEYLPRLPRIILLLLLFTLPTDLDSPTTTLLS